MPDCLAISSCISFSHASSTILSRNFQRPVFCPNPFFSASFKTSQPAESTALKSAPSSSSFLMVCDVMSSLPAARCNGVRPFLFAFVFLRNQSNSLEYPSP
eukprot:TRINITY_DN7009_c0_g2_i1.p2 TRINITY_DN7009_c0_g2~~TRINITY_DN7009_c0_g2_i1.p2  ORF type:complete len:101 (-),score=6.12 TRINITY_DN7009_c0_g2_i1:4-306(-)